MDARPAKAVLITGVYGTGKSSVAAEIGYLLEQLRQPYALLDLDFLGWADTGDGDEVVEDSLMLRNLAAVTSNYLDAGITRFVLAGFVRNTLELASVQLTLAMPLKVVRLVVPVEEIERRLAADVTTARREDLREAASSIAVAEGDGIEDLLIANDRPIDLVARGILEWLDWL